MTLSADAISSRMEAFLTIDADSDGVHDAGATPWHTFAATEAAAAAAADQAVAVTAASEARTQTTAQAEMDYRFALSVLANNRATDQAQQQIAD